MKISRRKLIVLGGGAIASSVLSMPAIASRKKIKVGACISNTLKVVFTES